MLKKILQVMQERRIIHKQDLAKILGVQIETLEDMLRLLVEKEYLKRDDCVEFEDTHCSSCPSASGCLDEQIATHDYHLTAKGVRYAKSE
ncbi:MAG: hypothetical protein JSW05_04135 [Candidatus Thorarchaeota archaeon]|nr:MAG: hypothetical protein JSW05_04135 [Candidatus Thorarchaeota archaeon]